MPIPDYQSLMLPVLRHAANGETGVLHVEQQVADELGLSEQEREELLPSGKQRVLHNRIHWAKFYMQKAGLIEAPKRGRFVATKLGKDLLDEKPQQINVETLRRYPAFVEFYSAGQRGAAKTNGGPVAKPDGESGFYATPEETIEDAYAAHNSALRSELLDRILTSSPSFFEEVIVSLLVAMGYGGTHRNAAKQLGKSGDGGVDGVINEDRLGLDRVYVQAKRYKLENAIGRPDVQAFVGSLVGFGASKGVFVTTSAFSRQAIDYAQHLPQRVILIDGNTLADLMIEHEVGVRVNRTVSFKRLDEDFFSEDA